MGVSKAGFVFHMWAYHEKAGFCGKDHGVGENGWQQEKRKNKHEADSIEKAIGLSAQEPSRAVQTGHGGCHSLSPGVGANVTAHNTHVFPIQSITVISGEGDGKCENPKAHFVFLISKTDEQSLHVSWALSPTAL